MLVPLRLVPVSVENVTVFVLVVLVVMDAAVNVDWTTIVEPLSVENCIFCEA
jgi:hypothetical protein